MQDDVRRGSGAALTDGRRPAAVVTGLAFAFAVAWSLIVPIFESPDEPHHWQYARYLHDEQRLPYFDSTFVEANSPPVYYALIAPVALQTDLPPHLVWSAPDGRLAAPFPPRLYMNAGGDFSRYWPVRTARLLTCLMMAAAVWFSALAAANATGSATAALLAAAFVGFLPEFTFRGSAVSNDTLVTTFAAATTALLITNVRRGASKREAVVTALCLAGAYLSKISAVCLVPATVVAAAIGVGGVSRRIAYASLVLGAATLLVLPWSVRNVVLYGDPFASRAMRAAVSNIIVLKPLTSPYFYTVFPSLLSRSFVGVFGWMNVAMPAWVYGAFACTLLAGGAGVGVALLRGRIDVRLVLLLSGIVGACLALVVNINRTFDQPQGRYMFPALPAIAILWAMGTVYWIGHDRRGRAIAWAIVVTLMGGNAFVLLNIVEPAYYPPIVSTLSTASLSLEPSFMSGLDNDQSGWRRVSNLDPQVAFATDVRAEDYGFLQFVLEGDSGAQPVQGAVYFAMDDKAGNAAQTAPFVWVPNGDLSTVIVPLLKHPLWRGRITTVRIDPFDPTTEATLGRKVRLSGVRLRGSLDR